MRAMEQQQSREEENKETIDMNITKFLATARAYLFGLIPARQPALIAIPRRPGR